MNIKYSPYFLDLRKDCKVRRKGALLKVEFQDDLIGYADCHPWPELGDEPIEEEIKRLNERRLTNLMRCSLQFARLDAEARKDQKPLLNEAEVPTSHYLISHLLHYSAEEIEDIIQQGYSHVKIKVGSHPSQEIIYLIELFASAPLKLRLDFNEKLSADVFESFWQAIESLHEKIDFVEDPFPFEPNEWKRMQATYSVRFACDRKATIAKYSPDAASFLVVKPAITLLDIFSQVPKNKLIITSYLGHPLGQLGAAYAASRIDPKGCSVHGLLAHHTYHPNSFSLQLSQGGPRFKAPLGWGFGYEELLNQVNWKSLVSGPLT